MGATNIFTYTLTNGSLDISSSNNVNRLSILCKSGTISFVGSSSFLGLPSDANTLSVGQGITLTAASISQPLDGIEISCATESDSCEIMLTFN